MGAPNWKMVRSSCICRTAKELKAEKKELKVQLAESQAQAMAREAELRRTPVQRFACKVRVCCDGYGCGMYVLSVCSRIEI